MGLPQTFNESQVKLSCPLLQEFFAGLTSFYYYFLSIASMCYHFKNTHQLSACCVSDGFYRAVLVTLFTPIQNQYKWRVCTVKLLLPQLLRFPESSFPARFFFLTKGVLSLSNLHNLSAVLFPLSIARFFCPETKVYSKWGNVSSAMWVKVERPLISQQQFSEILVHAVYWDGARYRALLEPPPRILGQYPTLLANLNPSWPKQCPNYP